MKEIFDNFKEKSDFFVNSSFDMFKEMFKKMNLKYYLENEII